MLPTTTAIIVGGSLPAPNCVQLLKPVSPYPPITDPLFADFFTKKLSDCQIPCNFQLSSADREAKHHKTKHLQEFLKFLNIDGSKLSDQQIPAVLNMVLANVVRAIPELSERLLVVENCQLPPEPAWQHLSLVYQILHRLLVLFPSGQYFTISLIRGVLGQIGTTYSPERESIATFVFSCARFAVFPYVQLLELCEGAIACWHGTANETFALQSVMITYLLILKGFSGAANATKTFCERIVVASITSLHFGQVRNQLTEIVGLVGGCCPAVAHHAARLLIRGWPRVIAEKQAACLKALAEILQAMPADVALIASIGPMIADALASPAYKVAGAAIELLECCNVMDALGRHEAARFRRIVKRAVSETASAHWGAEVRERVKPMLEALKQFQERKKVERENCEVGRLKKWVKVVEGLGDCEERAMGMKKLRAMIEMKSGHESGSATIKHGA